MQPHPPQPLTPIVVSSFPNAKALPLWIGEAAGVFQRFGLALEIDLTPGSLTQREKLLDGRIHVAQAAIDNALQLLVDGHEVIVAMGGESGMNDFIVQGDVADFSAFRGRSLVVDAPNTGYALQARKLLAGAGLRAGSDYSIVSVGNAGARFAAMRDDKANAGAVMNPPFSARAKALGMRSLGRMSDLLGPYQAGGAFVMRHWAEQNPQLLERYIKAYVCSLRLTLDPASRAMAVRLLAEKLAVPPAIAEAAYDDLADPGFGFTPDAKLDLAGVQNMLATRRQVEGAHAKIDAIESWIDLSYYDRALGEL